MNKEKLIEWFQEGNISIPKLLIVKYKALGLNEDEFVLLLQVMTYIQNGNSFPTPAELSKIMTLTDTNCSDILRKLIQKGFLAINEELDESGILYERYSLNPLWDKIIQMLLFDDMKKEQAINQKDEEDLYSIFEKEFGRPLSPFEIESLTMWLDQDHHDLAIIKAALREAVMSGKLNFRYIDRILFEWKKNGIRTIEQAQQHSQKFRQHQQKTKTTQGQPNEYKRSIPFYNWLES
ncbi:DnaD domain-containing protein [Bacillus sp. PS06]|uniref:DnaD domain-containing protein n=1 Tax=Bacillus sp. PS06 TaxID=2764176 RepID=UPI001780B2D9|nr:DnaD domain-containing protein [Bacillus sp. PS06]MBD8070212.1 DnaD domain-containing protein [Bacillus sp. PS06]